MSLKDELREMAMRLGADLFGVASAAELTDAPEGHRPTDILQRAESIIVLGMKMLDGQTDILPTEEDFFAGSPWQEMYKAHDEFVSRELDRIGYALARVLEKKGFKSYHQLSSAGGVDQRYLIGLLSLKHVAVRAGLGVFGHQSLVITPQYGPRVRLTALVTDAEMTPDKPLNKNLCKGCEEPCISLCPANALKKPSAGSIYEINKFACRTYLNTQPSCAICLKVCPVGNKRVR